MEKQRLFRIMAKADRTPIINMSEKIRKEHSLVLVKEPAKTLAMIKLREPVKSSLFYLGEVIVTECIVELDGVKGMAAVMGDDFEKTLSMAVIDAAYNSGIFQDEEQLLSLEAEQILQLQKENAMHLKTMVNFKSMDQEAPADAGNYKEA